MDRLILRLPSKRLSVILVILVAFGILFVKALSEGWFTPREPLDLSSEPTLLFFNRSKGCECVLVVYQAAERQIAAWPKADYSGANLIRIDLDHRPDVGRQFNIIRVPAMLLVDSNGQVIYQQTEAVSDKSPLVLVKFEQAIKDYANEK
ncbi:MAG: hypothetical protein CVU39_21970 [Chloroflexi bacterium HGW-Chloroflexi-10]|nr:MAG: hypothetical protein CVU39_21970 [Chloroflexi bacterium HGW-Chloroflexi-10]